jgi:hypothetical protein
MVSGRRLQRLEGEGPVEMADDSCSEGFFVGPSRRKNGFSLAPRSTVLRNVSVLQVQALSIYHG